MLTSYGAGLSDSWLIGWLKKILVTMTRYSKPKSQENSTRSGNTYLGWHKSEGVEGKKDDKILRHTLHNSWSQKLLILLSPLTVKLLKAKKQSKRFGSLLWASQETRRRISRKQWRQLNKGNVWCQCGYEQCKENFYTRHLFTPVLSTLFA